MKITRINLLNWIANKTNIRYRNEIYKTYYNGQYFFLARVCKSETVGNMPNIIKFYEKARGVFGLETNK